MTAKKEEDFDSKLVNPSVNIEDDIVLPTIHYSPQYTQMSFTRKLFSPEIDFIYEAKAKETAQSASNSISMLRKPGSQDDFVRGSTEHKPFRPGGMRDEYLEKKEAFFVDVEKEMERIEKKKDLMKIPVGLFPRGFFSSSEKDDNNEKDEKDDEKEEKEENGEKEEDDSVEIINLENVFDQSSFETLFSLEEEMKKNEEENPNPYIPQDQEKLKELQDEIDPLLNVPGKEEEKMEIKKKNQNLEF